MKIFRFWVKKTEDFTRERSSPRDKQPLSEIFRITCFGGSNASLHDAETKASEKINLIKQKIDGRELPPQEDYEVEIREEIVEELGPKNIVTRNRYGSRVLNTTDLPIFDVDKGADYNPTFIGRLFGAVKKSGKEIALNNLKQCIAENKLPGTGWRIYETLNGFRLIIGGISLDPNSPAFDKVVKLGRIDFLYAHLCKKQNCYRARLTPKPYRIKMPAIKYNWPQTEAELKDSAQWVQIYEEKSKHYGICKLVFSSGIDFSNHPIVAYHDRHCCKDPSLRLT